MPEADQTDLTTLTVQLLSAYVSNNMVPSSELASLIQSTRTALGENDAMAPVEEFPPAVTVRKSLGSRDYIISMIDGKPYKTLKRHLSAHGLTPAEYRARYQLPRDYPTVARGYSEQRREVAKRLGLGRKPAVPTSVQSKDAVLPASVEAVETLAPKMGTASKAKSALSAKTVKTESASKPSKNAKAASAVAKISKRATNPIRGRRTKTVPADLKATPAPASKTGRRLKIGPKTAEVESDKGKVT